VNPPEKREFVARKLAERHFEIEPELIRVLFLDIAPEDTITLLEISASTPASGSVDAFVFAPTDNVPYITKIAEVTPEEYEELKQDPARFRLPETWDLSKAKIFERRAP
jgi:hypothetical protein